MARGEEPVHLGHLAGPKKPRIDEDRLRTIPERPVREQRGDGRIEPAGGGHDRAFGNLFAQASDRVLDERCRVVHAELPEVDAGSSFHFARYFWRAPSSSGYLRARIAVARSAAFSAASRPTEATGMPGGIWTTDSRLS